MLSWVPFHWFRFKARDNKARDRKDTKDLKIQMKRCHGSDFRQQKVRWCALNIKNTSSNLKVKKVYLETSCSNHLDTFGLQLIP